MSTSHGPSFETLRTSVVDDVMIFRALLNDKSEPWSGKEAVSANDEP